MGWMSPLAPHVRQLMLAPLVSHRQVIGLWVLFDPNFTLQVGMEAGEWQWYSGHGPSAVLQCNVTSYEPNDLFNGGSHFGNAVRNLAEMDPHLLLHLLLPPLLFESAFAIDWHIFQKVLTSTLTLTPSLALTSTLTPPHWVAHALRCRFSSRP